MADVKRFSHDVQSEKKPWTNLDFGGGSDSDDFNFIVVSDRAGRPTPGIFEDAVEKINMLNPDFVMSVGDFIPGISLEDMSEEFIQKQWDYFENILSECEPPFFRVAGNHDINNPSDKYPGVHEMTTELWKKQFGVDYYSFVFKDVLFICLNTMDIRCDISDKQLEWALETLLKNDHVKWTMIFMHCPHAWDAANFSKLEQELNSRNYTVFAGDLHHYTRYRRQGRNYYMLGLTGGGSVDPGTPERGVLFGEFHHLTWVSFKNGEPRVTLLALDGIHRDDVVTIPKLTFLTPHYFRGDKPISEEEADRLEQSGLKIHRNIGDWQF